MNQGTESSSRNLLLGKELRRLLKSQHLEDSEYYINLADKRAGFERIPSDSERCFYCGQNAVNAMEKLFRKGRVDPLKADVIVLFSEKAHGHLILDHLGWSASNLQHGGNLPRQKDYSSLKDRVMIGIFKVWTFFQTQCCCTLNKPQYISKHNFYMY